MPEKNRQTHYETLQVHPAAPLDLVTAAYWRLNHEADQATDRDDIDRRRHQLAQAYAVLADPASRDDYDRAAGLPQREHAPKVPGSRPFPLKVLGAPNRRWPDHYEIIRVQPDAIPGVIEDAYATMRTQYLRLIRAGHAPVELLDALEEAYGVASDVERRRAYDQRRRGGANGDATNGAAAIAPAVRAEKTTIHDEQIISAPPIAKAPPPRIAPAKDKKRRDWRVRDRATSVARGLRTTFRGLTWLARRIFTVILLVPRVVFGFVKFFVAIVLSFGAARKAVEPRVRRIWPKEEEAIIARLKSSAGRSLFAPDRDAPDLFAIVEMLEGPDAGARFEVSRWPISIGSGSQCDIVLPDLAPEQLRLLNRDRKLILYSLCENPPVLVNDDAVAWSEVTANDSVQLGPHTIRLSPVEVGL